MNILYIHTHDSGRYWQPYGEAVPMPHTMALAREGILFRQAYSAAPTCSPSRAALMTGMAAHSSGMLGLAHRGAALKDTRQTMASWFSAHGYETVLCGVQHEATRDDALGYDVLLPFTPWLGVSMDFIDWDTRNAGLVCDYLAQKHEKPFFLSYGLVDTHRPYPPHERKQIDPDYVRVPPTVADTPEDRADMADYQCAAMAVDDCLGQVLEALERGGLAEDTVVLMSTDHGIAWPFMKCTLYDAGIGVAMLLRYPGMKRKGVVCDGLVSQIDVFPTLCALTGVPEPDWLQGVSLLPLLERGEPVREQIFAEVNYHAAYEPMRCVRTDRYKLIVRYDEYDGVIAPNIDASPAKDALRRAGYMESVPPRDELYDLVVDPAEKQDVAHDPRYARAYADLWARLRRWMEETDDPLLRYPVRIPLPAGAKVNCREGYDPEEGPFEPEEEHSEP